MTINIIVAAVTLLMCTFAAVWLLCPRCRPWFEAPKQQPLRWDRPPGTSENGAKDMERALKP
jgi:hypothetical protein